MNWVRDVFDYHPDGYLVWRDNRGKVRAGDIAGGVNAKGRWYVFHNNKGYQSSRLIFYWHYGFLPDLVDHKDRNPLNNKVENLRPLSKSLNNANSNTCTSATGFRGVVKLKSGTFKAQIKKNYKCYNLGQFNTPEEAYEKYLRAREEFFPEVFTTTRTI